MKVLNSGPVGSPNVPESGESRTRRFGAFEIDLHAGELRRSGLKVKLQEQPFQILALLLERPGEVVTREDLRNRLWPADTFVDFDHSLNAAIKRLRNALGDAAENPRFVETVARRGYRFLAPVNGSHLVPELVAPVPGVHRSIGKWQIAGAAVVMVLAGVAVGLWLGRGNPSHQAATPKRLTANPSEAPVIGGVISSDGKYLAFADKTGFYLRQIETGETHPVPLPAGFDSNAPSWAPDGGFDARPLSWFPDGVHLVVGWVASAHEEQSLWEISVLGGTPRKLIDEGFRASVSPDGSQIAFVRGVSGQQELWRMQSDGQNPRKEVGEPGYEYGGIVWSPDGTSLAYVRSRFEPAYSRMHSFIELRNLSSGKSEVLLSDPRLGAALAWAPGRLIYSLAEPPPNQNDSNLWSAPFDGRAHLSGPAIRLTSESGFAGGVSITADGKRLAFFKQTRQPDVYVTELNPQGTRLSEPRRLTLDEREDFPYSWTPDGKSILFMSDRDGTAHIFRQGVDQATPELLLGGKEALSIPRLTPDGKSIVYLITPKLGETARKVRLMRAPLAGGPPEFVLESLGISNLQCARLPSTLCIFSEVGEAEERFYRFDPVKGQPQELLKARTQSDNYYDFNWTLSPDGRTLAMSKKAAASGDPTIRLLSLADYSERNIRVPGWSGICCFDWAPDGKSMWVSVYTNAGKRALLNVDLQGKAKPVLEEDKMMLGWAIPSPDGRHLAIWEASGSSNVWMLENF
ncbi:MAG: winged helix-turn-helix domain-containing protein [Acidobacteriia bacterium]|nr:winged helix-turn-helix domain-containing protein [Terriglobia bacterium]